MPLVLIADDDKAVRVQLKRMLEKSAHKVIEAGTAEEVLEQAKKQEPDLIIIDVNLPDKEALHLLEELRAESNLARTPVMKSRHVALRSIVSTAMQSSGRAALRPRGRHVI